MVLAVIVVIKVLSDSEQLLLFLAQTAVTVVLAVINKVKKLVVLRK